MIQEVTVHWSSQADSFSEGRYSRDHIWHSKKGWRIEASSSPDIVPIPYSNPTMIDPEEAFLASVSSCHMLWFIDLARRAGFRATDYVDHATGQMTSDSDGQCWISEISLAPRIIWVGPAPNRAKVEQLHAEAHQKCFIANSVKTAISIRQPSA